LQWYYENIERSSWGEIENCDSFVITWWDSEILNYFNDRITRWNTLQYKNSNENIVVSINLSDIKTEAELSTIKTSNPDNQTELIASFVPLDGMTVWVCFALFEIIEVKQ
jgi:hypothetical protein